MMMEGLKTRLLTCRPAFAECDFVVLTCESPFPPVLPPVFPAIAVSCVAAASCEVNAYLYRQACLLVISGVLSVAMV